MQALSRSEKSAKSVGIYSTNASAQRELSPLSSSFTFYSLVHIVSAYNHPRNRAALGNYHGTVAITGTAILFVHAR